MATFLVILQLLIVLALIFIGARLGGIGLGIYGMVGVFILVFVFGLRPGKLPIDVMLIIVSVITAAAALQAAGWSILWDWLPSFCVNIPNRSPITVRSPRGFSVLWPAQPTPPIPCFPSYPR